MFILKNHMSNAFGTAEFVQLCRKVGAEPVIGVNMGSGTPEEAMAWVEYCNGSGATQYAQLRRSHGYPEPFHVRRWCLGNEMYAPWQFGRMDAKEYALQAERFATAMRWADPSLRLTAVGLETDPKWNWTVAGRLRAPRTRYQPGEWIDALSAHYYPIGCAGAFEGADYRTRTSLGAFFHERSVLMRDAIHAACNDAQCPVHVVWDEWNPMGDRDGTEFTLEMALWVALILQSFIHDSAFVTAANYTFFIGGNGPVQPCGEGVIRHAEYYALKLYGDLLGEWLVDCWTDIPTRTVFMPPDRRWGKPEHARALPREIPLVDTVATCGRDQLTVFCINLDEERDAELEVALRKPVHPIADVHTLWHPSLHARNTPEAPQNVSTTRRSQRVEGGCLRVKLPRHSLSAIVLRMEQSA